MTLAGLAFGMMASCQDDEVVNVNNGESEGDAYMSLSIEMPNVDGSTRAINGGSETAPGTEEEQKITSLKLFVFNEKGEVKNSKVDYQASELVPVKPNPASPSNATTYTIPAFKIESGNKKVLVIINPLNDKFESANATLMGQSMQLTEEEIKTISTNSAFMMTNINRSHETNGLVEVDVQGTKNNPTSVTVEVERSVAKIEDVTTNYEFTVKNTQNDKVVFQNVVLMNGNKKFFPIMQIQQNAENQSNDYVKDPNFDNNTDKGNFISDNFYSAEFTAGSFTSNDQNKYTQALSSEEKAPNALYYTLENTMTKEQQMNAYTTGLYYQAQYKLNNQEDHVYMFDGKLYTFESLQNSANDLGIKLNDPETGAELTNDSSQDDFDKIGVKKYVNGVCYYPYWIKHVDSPDATLDAMEFAVVRNNYYQITINSVKEIGSYKPVNPDPNTPDEEVEAYLDVKVKVLPWTVRKNQIDF